MAQEKQQLRWSGYVRLAVITALVYVAFRYLLPLVWPFLFALLAAGILRPVVRFLSERLRVPVSLAAILCASTLALLLGVAGYFLGRVLVTQLAQLLSNLDAYLAQLQDGMEHVCHSVEQMLSLERGVIVHTVKDGMARLSTRIGDGMFAEVREHTWDVVRFVAKAVTALFVFLIATVLIVKEMLDRTGESAEPNGLAGWHSLRDKLSQIGMAYLKTQGILILIIAGILTLGLTLLKNKYALLIGIGVGLMDAFPVLGSGMVLVPWSVVAFFFGSRYHGIVLLVLFIICQVTRELLEPRLLGDRIGIRPIYTLLAMYVGLKLFGIPGFLLGPVGLVLIQALAEETEGMGL